MLLLSTSVLNASICSTNIVQICLCRLSKTYVRDILSLSQQFSHQAHPDENEYSEFVCNSCEQRRELHDPTYYFEAGECHCVAHVHCQLSEILPILEEEWSLACKLGNTKLDISTIGCEDNTSTRVSNVLTIEEIMEEEGVEQEYHVGADEVDMASKSSRKVFSGVSTDNEIMERGVPSAIASKTGRARVASDSSLIELDEEIVVLSSEVEWLATKLKATERRLKELEERHPQHVASPLPISRDGLNVE